MPELTQGTHLVEGIVVRSPGGRFVIQLTDEHGQVVVFDPQEALAQYEGQEVRMTVATMEALEALTRLYEAAQAGEAPS